MKIYFIGEKLIVATRVMEALIAYCKDLEVITTAEMLLINNNGSLEIEETKEYSDPIFYSLNSSISNCKNELELKEKISQIEKDAVVLLDVSISQENFDYSRNLLESFGIPYKVYGRSISKDSRVQDRLKDLAEKETEVIDGDNLIQAHFSKSIANKVLNLN